MKDIYITENFVYKIFDKEEDNYFFKASHIKKFEHLDQELLTIPISFVYINGEFSGFKMNKCGLDLKTQFMNGTLTFEELINISNELKNIQLYLKKKYLIHGDIQLSNILYQNNKVTLTDINSMLRLSNWLNRSKFYGKFDGGSVSCPDDYYFWALHYGEEYLDYLATNFCTFLLLNYSQKEINDLNKEYSEVRLYKKTERFTDNRENKVFDDDIFDYFIDAFSGNRKELYPCLYLIDHLKK